MMNPTHQTVAKSPQEVVQRIRREHWEITSHLTEVEDLANRVQRGDEEAAVALRDRLQVLSGMMRSHLHFEEYELVPLMIASDRYDQSSIETLRQDHEAQRKLLTRVISELRSRPAGAKLAIETKELVHALRDDMRHEEQDLLVGIAS